MYYIFVHGFAGWGSYDDRYQKMPYWGMRGGDLIAWLREQGFDAYAASVSPKGSARDRACELYAQLAGTRVDYGEAHSIKFRHERYGRDYSACPLIPEWNDDTQLALIGHSFGGTTARLFAELMANGSPTEMEATTDGTISPLFRGGMGQRIHSIAAVASGLNGNSAYTMLEDPAFNPKTVRVPLKARFYDRIFSAFTKKAPEGRDPRDTAEYDMHIDRALAMNQEIRDLPHVYHYSVPCSYTRKRKDGSYVPEKDMESVFVMQSAQMGCYTGMTEQGFRIDQKWQRNDGRVSTISEIAPFGSVKKRLLPGQSPKPGVWNVYPIYHGDHMSLQGGLRHRNDIRSFYKELLTTIESTIITRAD